MADMDKAIATQLANIEKKTGKTIAQLTAAIKKSGKSKHGEIRDWLKETYSLGHGDANTLTHVALKPAGAGDAPAGDALNAIYTGKKQHLRPIHEKLMAAINKFGEHEVAPKKGYVSLRRKKQFAMLGPKTNDRFELGLNLKADIKDPRAQPQPPGGMCNYIIALTRAEEIDSKLIGYIRQAYDAAG